MSCRILPVCLAAVVSLGMMVSAAADDWPQWNGPARNGRLLEGGLVEKVPDGGVPRLWSQPVQLGYSGPAVVDGRVFLTDYVRKSGEISNNPGSRDRLTGTERVLCFDGVSGQPLWKHEYDRPYAVSYGSGPRATPTVHDGLVYALGAEGDLICLQADSGDVVWQHRLADKWGAATPLWGHSAAPLVYQNSLICLVGGPGSLDVALDPKTGEEKWRALTSEDTGYCPPVLITAGETKQLLIWDPHTLHSLNPDNGEEYWQHALKPGYGMSILPPVQEGELLFASGESGVSAMYQLSRRKPAAEVLWRGNPRNSIYLATAAAVFDNGYLYGCDSRSGALVCARASDGKRMWQTTRPTSGGDRQRGPSHGSAYLLKTQTGYLIFSETGDLISAQLTPDGYVETGRCHVIDPTEDMRGRNVAWTFPAVSDGRLYVRSGEELACVDLAVSR